MTVYDFDAEKKKREEDQKRRRKREAELLETAEIFVDVFEEMNGGSPFEKFSWIRLGTLYALASICYYKYDFAPISDALFDSLCLYLLDNLEEALENRAGGLGNQKFLDAEMLAAGSGYDVERFPNYLIDVGYYVELLMQRRQDAR
jgi:hypothetical protein